MDDRGELSSGDYVAVEGGLRRTPLKELTDMFDIAEELQTFQDALQDLSGFSEISGEDQEELEEIMEEAEGVGEAARGLRRMISAFSREEDIYRVDPSDEMEFVLIPEEENFEKLPLGFPSVNEEYLVLGKVLTKFRRGDSIELINFSQLVEGSSNDPRQRKTEIKKNRMRFAKMASDLSGRKVDKDEFHITYPAVQIDPLAIY